MYHHWTWDSSFVKEKGETKKNKKIKWCEKHKHNLGIWSHKSKENKRKRKKKLLKQVEIVESQASVTGTGISTKKLVLCRPEVSFQTTSPYCFKNFVPVCISGDHHLLTICINFHFLYPCKWPRIKHKANYINWLRIKNERERERCNKDEMLAWHCPAN